MRPSVPGRKVKKMRASATILFALAASLLAGASPTGKKPDPAGTPAKAAVSKVATPRKPARSLKFDPLKIEGHVPKPQAIYTLERSRTSFGDLEPDDDFVPKILESVEGEPF